MITQDTVWFQVSYTKRADGLGHDGGGYMISKRTFKTLYTHRAPGWWGGDFATKAEAIAHGQAHGWVLVENWKQAQAQAAPIGIALQDRAEAFNEAHKGLVEIRIELAIGTKFMVRYVTPEFADALRAQLADADEFGVVR